MNTCGRCRYYSEKGEACHLEPPTVFMTMMQHNIRPGAQPAFMGAWTPVRPDMMGCSHFVLALVEEKEVGEAR